MRVVPLKREHVRQMLYLPHVCGVSTRDQYEKAYKVFKRYLFSGEALLWHDIPVAAWGVTQMLGKQEFWALHNSGVPHKKSFWKYASSWVIEHADCDWVAHAPAEDAVTDKALLSLGFRHDGMYFLYRIYRYGRAA